ncbi:MAG: LD-carboxypeptidase [Acidobacteria bacterium]|nr:LD-carboxypeptidase [Acidobacteriota bacterium]
MIRPRRVQPGDRIALVAPASGFKPGELAAGIAELRRLGFDPVYDHDILQRARFEAGPAAVRAEVIHRAWADPSIAALLAVRGGYGSQQLLPLLDASLARESAKLLIGYSDITALHAWLLQQGIGSLQGPMIERRLSVGPSAYDEASFLSAMRPEPMGALAPPSLEVLRRGEYEGVIAGGTLTQLVSLLGTPWAESVPYGAILLLEDIGERPYRIHRMLTQLAQSGLLARAGAIVFGEFTRCDEDGGTVSIKDVLRDFVDGFQGPVLFGFPFGHAREAVWSVPLGVRGRVTTAPARLIVEEALVS